MSPSKPRGPVAYVLRKFPVLSETFVLGEMIALEERGVPVHVFSLMRPNDPRFHEDLARLKGRVSYVPDLTDWRKLLRHGRRLARSEDRRFRRAFFHVLGNRKPVLAWRFAQAAFVANEARRLKVRHFHAHFANRATSVALLASRLTGIPFSFTAHATDIFKESVDRKALARKAAEAKFVATVSEYNRSHLQALDAFPSNKIRIVLNGIDIDRYSPNGTPPWRPFQILSVARLVEKKGHFHLIDACRRLAEAGLDFQCRIVGKGALRSRIHAAIKEAGLRDRVHLEGPKTQGEVLDYYHSSHLYVLPAIVGSDGNREGLPVSIVEALSAGLPVVSTTVTGIPEVIEPGHNGFLVEPGDSEGLAEKIAHVASDPARWEALRQGARPSVVTAFDRRETIRRLHQLMESAEAAITEPRGA